MPARCKVPICRHLVKPSGGLEPSTPSLPWRFWALDIPEQVTIIRALEDPPAGLEELRAVLLQEHTWRTREGLA